MAVSDHVVSFVDGRVRLRHPALKDAAIAGIVTGVLSETKGILSAGVNPRLGSLLITYAPERLSKEQLLELAEQGLKLRPALQHGEEARPGSGICFGKTFFGCLTSRNLTRLTSRFMLGTLGASLAGATLGRSSLHVLAGGLFTVAGLQHILAHRKTL